jgi:hypothetical protein
MEFILANLINILWPASKPPDMAGSQETMSEDYQKILRLQEKEKELQWSYKANEEKISTLQIQMDDMRSTESDILVKDTKSALRLPTCPPTKFSGVKIDYMPWKRTWEATMGKSFQDKVQLMNLKTSIPTRTCNLIMHMKLNSDRKNLDTHETGNRITGYHSWQTEQRRTG